MTIPIKFSYYQSKTKTIYKITLLAIDQNFTTTLKLRKPIKFSYYQSKTKTIYKITLLAIDQILCYYNKIKKTSLQYTLQYVVILFNQ